MKQIQSSAFILPLFGNVTEPRRTLKKRQQISSTQNPIFTFHLCISGGNQMFVEVFVGVRHQTRFLEPPYAPCPFVWRHPFFFHQVGTTRGKFGV